MIFDHLSNLDKYSLLRKKDIMKFIDTHDLLSLPDGQIDIDGDELFVRVMSYVPKIADENKFETHRFYADLQLVITGVEMMQTCRQSDLKPMSEYDSTGDYQFFYHQGPINTTIVKAQEFMVFFPGEAHRPSCRFEDNQSLVKKLVFKIRYPQWQEQAYGISCCGQ